MPARTKGRAKFDSRGRQFVWWVDGDYYLRIVSQDKTFAIALALGTERDDWPTVGVVGHEFPGVLRSEPRPVWLAGPPLTSKSMGGWVDDLLRWAFDPDRPLRRRDEPRFAGQPAKGGENPATGGGSLGSQLGPARPMAG